MIAMVMLFVLGGVQAADARLAATLDKLDAASARFVSAQANVRREAYTALIQDTSTTNGTIYFLRQGKSTEMGLKTIGPEARTIVYRNGTVKDYNPGLKCYDTVTKAGVDTYLTLGFGGSGKDLAKAWNITDNGPDMMEGTKVEKLELVPKDANVRSNVTRVQMWVDLDRDVTLKQIFFTPAGDTNTAVFTDIDTKKKPDTKKWSIEGKPCGQ
jgi:outer membrane lipoprotein-sorting protein